MNRTGTYVAFDGLGKENPTESDFKYYATIQAWSANKKIDFRITNSHEKASSVSDTSKKATLMASIQERFRGSKNMLIVLSSDTRKSGSVLSDEIEMAIDNYEIPLIIAYVDYRVIAAAKDLSSYFPYSLSSRLSKPTTNAIHIPFAKDAIFCAINQFSPEQPPKGVGYGIYDEGTYKAWGLLGQNEAFTNKRT